MAADRNEAQSGSTLRRALGRTTATLLTAAMIIGTGLFAALGATTEKAGSGLLLAMNFIGIELNAKVLIVTLFVELALLGVFVGFAIPSSQAAHLTPVLGPGAVDVLAGAAIFFWSWDGFMRMAIMASEVKEPRRTIPFAVIGGIVIAAIVFLAVAAAALGVLGTDAIRIGGSRNDTLLLTAGAKAIGRWGGWVVLAAAWLDTLTEAHGDMLTTTRVALAMGKGHELPGWLGAIHPRFRSPHHAVIAIGVVCAALALFVNLRPVLEVAN